MINFTVTPLQTVAFSARQLPLASIKVKMQVAVGMEEVANPSLVSFVSFFLSFTPLFLLPLPLRPSWFVVYSATLFIGNLQPTTPTQELEKLFGSFGRVLHVKHITHKVPPSLSLSPPSLIDVTLPH